MGMFNIGKQSIISDVATQEAPKPLFGGKQHKFGAAGSEERKQNAAKAAATRAKNEALAAAEKAELLAIKAAYERGERSPAAAAPTLTAAPQTATAVAPAAPKAPKGEDKRSLMQQAFNFKLSVPTGTKVQVAGQASCNTTALAGGLALTYPSFGFVHGVASYDWVAVLTHRATKTIVMVCAKGSTVTVCTQYPVQEIPGELATDLGLIENLIASIAA